MYKLFFSKAAQKDANKLQKSKLAGKCKKLLALIAADPFSAVLPYEKLVGDLEGVYYRRINIQHRLVYTVDEAEKIIKILRMWTHYE